MAVTVSPAHRQRLQEMAETWERLAELEKRHPTAENNNVIEFVLPPNDRKTKVVTTYFLDGDLLANYFFACLECFASISTNSMRCSFFVFASRASNAILAL